MEQYESYQSVTASPSILETNASQGGGGDSGTDVTMLVFCLACLGFLGVFGFLVIGAVRMNEMPDDDASGVSGDMEGGGGPSGGGGGGAQLPVEVMIERVTPRRTGPPPFPTARPTGPLPFPTPEPVGPPTSLPPGPTGGPEPPTLPQSRETTKTRKTGTAPPRKELVCTVHYGAVLDRLYPPDRLCHYLYYTHVYVRKEKIVPVEIEESFEVFKAQFVSRYRSTEGGLSFDIRYTSKDDITPNVRLQLSRLANTRIKHYGTLNVLARDDKMQALMDKAKDLLSALKRIQGTDETRKTIIAIGLFDYNGTIAWNRYKDWIKTAVDEYEADTVIAISSYLGTDDITKCRILPADSLDTDDDAFPSVRRHSELVTSSFQYQKVDAVVGLTLYMGARQYKTTLGQEKRKNTKLLLYAGCDAEESTNIDSTCEANRLRVLSGVESNVNLGFQGIGLSFFWDTRRTLLKKVNYVKGIARHRFAWLYLDLNLADVGSRCTEQWQNLRELKSVFGVGNKP